MGVDQINHPFSPGLTPGRCFPPSRWGTGRVGSDARGRVGPAAVGACSADVLCGPESALHCVTVPPYPGRCRQRLQTPRRNSFLWPASPEKAQLLGLSTFNEIFPHPGGGQDPPIQASAQTRAVAWDQRLGELRLFQEAPYTLYPTPYTLHLHPTPYTLYPIPHTPHPTPHTPHPTPHTPHPTPHTPHPTPHTPVEGC